MSRFCAICPARPSRPGIQDAIGCYCSNCTTRLEAAPLDLLQGILATFGTTCCGAEDMPPPKFGRLSTRLWACAPRTPLANLACIPYARPPAWQGLLEWTAAEPSAMHCRLLDVPRTVLLAELQLALAPDRPSTQFAVYLLSA